MVPCVPAFGKKRVRAGIGRWSPRAEHSSNSQSVSHNLTNMAVKCHPRQKRNASDRIEDS